MGRAPALVLIGATLAAFAATPAHAQSADTVVVGWTAPGDDGAMGTATTYDLRVSESPINASNFTQALTVPGMPTPRVSGTPQSVTVYGLTRGTTYYFAIRTADDRGNWSALSNLVQFDWNIDTTPPAAPQGAQALSEGDGVHLSWNPNTEPDLAGYNVYRRIAGGSATRLNNVLLTDTHYIDTTAPPDPQGVTYEITAVDVRGNESAHTVISNIAVITSNAWALKPGYPNPSRVGQSVRIPLVIPTTASGAATVQILDSGGRLVRRITIANLSPGSTEVTWDGLNDAGRVTAPGVYRGWLVAGDVRSSVRLLRVP